VNFCHAASARAGAIHRWGGGFSFFHRIANSQRNVRIIPLFPCHMFPGGAIIVHHHMTGNDLDQTWYSNREPVGCGLLGLHALQALRNAPDYARPKKKTNKKTKKRKKNNKRQKKETQLLCQIKDASGQSLLILRSSFSNPQFGEFARILVSDQIGMAAYVEPRIRRLNQTWGEGTGGCFGDRSDKTRCACRSRSLVR